MSYDVGTYIDLRDLNHPTITTKPSEPGWRGAGYVPGTRIIFQTIKDSLEILRIMPAGL